MKKLAILAAACVLPLSACYSVQGPPQVIGNGKVLPNQIADGDLETRFREDALAALSSPKDAAKIDIFLRRGISLVYGRCNDYFWNAGKNQLKARFARDTIAPIVTLLTGVIALRDFTDPDREKDLLQMLTLGSSFTTSGLDSYDRHFLFGADNIDSVRELTLKALSVHSDAVLDKVFTDVNQAVMHLIDHQGICTPPHILALTREAITNGKVEPTGTRTTTTRDTTGVLETTTTTTTTSTDPDEKVGVHISPE